MKDLDDIERLELREHFTHILERSQCQDPHDYDRVIIQIEKEIMKAITEHLKQRGKL